MSYTIAIVDTYDRDFLTYEIWDSDNNHIAEVYRNNKRIILKLFCKETEIQLDFLEFVKILEKIKGEIIGDWDTASS